ncbi:hypothetical protein BC829DRAFT_231148 [Chytridium lagenaria]|nr:hypothetical protein BC829DRAFT_231148 [Chytridium lagenaria]
MRLTGLFNVFLSGMMRRAFFGGKGMDYFLFTTGGFLARLFCSFSFSQRLFSFILLFLQAIQELKVDIRLRRIFHLFFVIIFTQALVFMEGVHFLCRRTDSKDARPSGEHLSKKKKHQRSSTTLASIQTLATFFAAIHRLL